MTATAQTVNLPNAGWRLVKCNCNHLTCERHTVEHPSVYGCFYQGCGWSLAEATQIRDRLNGLVKIPEDPQGLEHTTSDLKLSTGRDVRGCYAGIVGIDAEGRVFGGCDDTVETEGWTRAEREELARHMVRLWSEFLAAAQRPTAGML